MDDLTSRFSRLGQAVAEVSDRGADPTTLPNARRRFLSDCISDLIKQAGRYPSRCKGCVERRSHEVHRPQHAGKT